MIVQSNQIYKTMIIKILLLIVLQIHICNKFKKGLIEMAQVPKKILNMSKIKKFQNSYKITLITASK